MNQNDRKQEKAERLRQLSQTSPDTPMGKLLRRFWQPVALSGDVANGQAKPLKALGEELTLYRGDSGRAYLVGGRCAHRLTLLHTGWVQGEEIRCAYHGWKYDGGGQCVQRPAEKDKGLPDVKIAGYPVHEYCGLVFAYMGDGPAPEFDLPRKEVFERKEGVVFPRIQVWDCNWFQQVENSLDAVHVSFVHQLGNVGPFGAAVTQAIPELTYSETDAGIEQVATRSKDNVRKSDWTFPNNNHIVIPSFNKDDPWTDVGVWMVPIDDEYTMRVGLYASPLTGAAAKEFMERCEKSLPYNPADHYDDLFLRKIYPDDPVMELTGAQDYVALKGQGTIADRANEQLGWSDTGIMTLRKLFFREMEAISNGQPTKQWRRLRKATEMPKQPGEAQTTN
ncbi:MAG: iron-sulfur containing oxygenase [Noviherbaspirillum sp.]|nr:iron-sulfur containing oxygenase [Noviherbaspirillum sp.]